MAQPQESDIQSTINTCHAKLRAMANILLDYDPDDDPEGFILFGVELNIKSVADDLQSLGNILPATLAN